VAEVVLWVADGPAVAVGEDDGAEVVLVVDAAVTVAAGIDKVPKRASLLNVTQFEEGGIEGL